jgi:hypothetical protein
MYMDAYYFVRERHVSIFIYAVEWSGVSVCLLTRVCISWKLTAAHVFANIDKSYRIVQQKMDGGRGSVGYHST